MFIIFVCGMCVCSRVVCATGQWCGTGQRAERRVAPRQLHLGSSLRHGSAANCSRSNSTGRQRQEHAHTHVHVIVHLLPSFPVPVPPPRVRLCACARRRQLRCRLQQPLDRLPAGSCQRRGRIGGTSAGRTRRNTTRADHTREEHHSSRIAHRAPTSTARLGRSWDARH